jgi:hypothetical protein
MKNDTTESIKVFPPGNYLVTLVAKQLETEIIDEFQGWGSDGQPVYDGHQIEYYPEHCVEVRSDDWVSELSIQLKASIKLTKEGIKNKIKDFNFSVREAIADQF